MADDDCRCIVMQGSLEDLAGIDGRAVHCSSEQLLVPNQAMPGIQKQTPEDLMRQVGQTCLKESSGVTGRLQRAALGARGLEVAPPEFDSGLDGRDPSRPHAVDVTEIGRAGRYNPGKPTRPGQKLLRQRYGVAAGRTPAE